MDFCGCINGHGGKAGGGENRSPCPNLILWFSHNVAHDIEESMTGYTLCPVSLSITSQSIVTCIYLMLVIVLHKDTLECLILNEGLSRHVRDYIYLVLILLLLSVIWHFHSCICVWIFTFTFRKFLFDGISFPVVIARSVMSF